MAIFEVTDPRTGQTLELESKDNSPPTEQELEQVFASQQPQATQATEEQFLGAGERISGRFRRPEDLTQVRAQQRQERGLAPETPLEPTGFNLKNFLDLPTDIAEGLVSAFPVIGAIGGGALAGAAALPTAGASLAAVAGAGALGAAGATALRQEIGQRFFGFDQGKIIDRLGEVAKEGAFGALQEVGGVFLGRALNATKLGLLKTANNLLRRKGGEGFVRGFGSLATHLDKAQTQFALDAVKRGDRRVLKSFFAQKDFADKFAQKLFFGTDRVVEKNLPVQLAKLARRPGSKEAVKELYQRFIPSITDDVFETMFRLGDRVNQFNQPNTILKLGTKINSGLDDLFVKAGKELEVARSGLTKSAGNVPVGESLTQINTILSQKLKSIGFLIDEGGGAFSINPSFAGTRTGTEQAKMFGQLVSRFFGSEGDDALVAAATRGDRTALIKLANKSTAGRRKVFNITNNIKYRDFAKQLGSFDVQISGNEFKALGKLSPELTVYLQGLRGIPLQVEQQIGGSQVAALTKTFSEFAQGAIALRQGSKVKSVAQIESALQRFAKAQPGTTASVEAEQLNSFLQRNLKVNFLDELNTFKAAQVVKELNKPFGDEQLRRSVTSLMKNSFDETTEKTTVNILKSRIDSSLPKNLRLGEMSEVHTVASNLHRNAASLLRGRFLLNAAVAPTIGGLGGTALGPVGAVGGIAAGLAIQNPGILRTLIKASAGLTNRQVKDLAVKGIGQGTTKALQRTPGGARLLQQLLQQRQ